MKKLAVTIDFLTDQRRNTIESAAKEAGYKADFYPEGAIPTDRLSNYEIVYGMPPIEQLKMMSSLKWFCASFAGVENYLSDDVYPSADVLLSNSSGAYGDTIGEHVIMVLLMLMRQMPVYMDAASRHEWNRTLPMRSIADSEITILGTGNLGTCIAQRAKALGARHIIGVRRTNSPAAPCFDEIITYDRLDEVLPRSHVLVGALPATDETIGMLTRSRLNTLPSDALFINVGRGSLVDQDALVELLQSRVIAGAALDVMMPEPLPENHPLWRTPNTIITPHVSGNMSLPYTCDLDVQLFCSDLLRYSNNLLPERLVDRKHGY